MKLLLLTIFVLAITAGSAQTDWDKINSQFTEWLYNTIQAYPTWVKENNYDPSPVMEGPLVIGAPRQIGPVVMNITVINHYVSGHSCEGQEIVAYGQLLELYRRIEVRHRVRNVPGCTWVFAGEYIANGTIIDEDNNMTIPFHSAGHFNITTLQAETYLYLTDYEIDEETGIIDVTSGRLSSEPFFSYVNPKTIVFEGLWDNDELAPYKEKFQEQIWRIYEANFHFGGLFGTTRTVHPLSNLFRLYFETAVNSTSLAEIIGYWPINPSVDFLFTQHLIGMMKNYTNWLKEGQLDPSLPKHEMIETSGYRTMPPELKYRILTSSFNASGHYIMNHSEGAENDEDISGGLLMPYYQATFGRKSNSHWIYGGEYKAEGQLMFNDDDGEFQRVFFVGKGEFKVVISDIFEDYTCSGFRVDQNGFIHLADASCNYLFMAKVVNEETTFEGIQGFNSTLSEEHHGLIESELANIYYEQVLKHDFTSLPKFPEINPGMEQLIKFYNRQVPATSLVDVIGSWPPQGQTNADLNEL